LKGKILKGSLRGAKLLRNLYLRLFGEENIEGEFKRGIASLAQPIPLPLIKGKGIKGIGLIR